MNEQSTQAFAASLAAKSDEELARKAASYPEILNDIDQGKYPPLGTAERISMVVQEDMVRREIARRTAAK